MRLRRAHELLDEDEGTPEEIRRSLDELWWINQHLGGVSTWRGLLEKYWAQAAGPEISLLDVGAGTGQMARANADWLRARGAAVTAVTLDRMRSHLGCGGGAAVAGDAYRLPFGDASVDVVTCNLFLHHFHDVGNERAATRLLAEMARVARRAVVINDLDRSWWPYLAIQILGLRFSRITRHDGPRSVRQAYTRPELEALGRGVGAGRVEAMRLWPYRLGMIVWKGDV